VKKKIPVPWHHGARRLIERRIALTGPISIAA